MSKDKPPAIRDEVNQFLQKVAETPNLNTGKTARLLFALDATASREPTWDTACQLQAEMFMATQGLGNLEIQLCYYRGFNELNTSAWCRDADTLLRQMTGVKCLGGHTQIGRLLRHAVAEHKKQPVQAVVFVGDAMEEAADDLCHLAGQAGMLKLPLFLFQEGVDPVVRNTYQQMSHLSGGAYAPFDASSAGQLKALLSAVAIFAVGGRKALENFANRSGQEVKRLTNQIR